MDKYSQLKLFNPDNVNIKGNLILEQIFDKSKIFKNNELNKENINYFNNRLRIIKKLNIHDIKDIANYMADNILPVFIFNDLISKMDNRFKVNFFNLWFKNQNENFELNQKIIKDVSILAKEIVNYNLEEKYMFSLLESAFIGAVKNNNIGGDYFNYFKDNKLLLKQFLNLYIKKCNYYYNSNFNYDIHATLNLNELIKNILNENLLNDNEIKELYIKIKDNKIKIYDNSVLNNFENYYQKIILKEALFDEINNKNNIKVKKRAI